MTDALTAEQVWAFLEELTALTRKHGIRIGGCGCCGSPYLEPCKPEGKYTIEEYSEPEAKAWDNLDWDYGA